MVEIHSLSRRLALSRRRIYDEELSDNITNGYARLMSDEEAAQVSPMAWYLPYYGMESVNKHGKVRSMMQRRYTDGHR